jgi:hypothetical protein
MIAVTYIVSAFNRPQHLRGCLASLQVQTDPNWYAIVADNGTGDDARANWKMAHSFAVGDRRIDYCRTSEFAKSPAWDCYWSAEWIVSTIPLPGEWIVLPSDDSIYMPVFQETCLQVAREHDWQLVYTDMLYDRRGHGRYHHKVVAPRCCEIDKTCFMLRRDCWIGFPTKPQTVKASSCDGEMIEQLVRNGVRHGRVPEPLVVHS